MFSFLTKKQSLKDVIPPNYVDIHSHLLPGIDDGAKSISDTVALVSKLKSYGFSEFITTPHIMQHVWENTRSSIGVLLKDTIEDLHRQGLNIPLHAAAEYMMDGNFMNLLTTEKLLTIKDNYILVEMSYINPPLQLFDILFEIQLEGYIPILAHPERYSFYHSKLDAYQKLKNAGCKFQVNLLSTVGYYGREVADTASLLLQKGLIDFTGSDVHHMKHVAAFSAKIKPKDVTPLQVAMENNSLFRF